jgi:RNA polymerase sigma-70 factor (ECF subfamily)
MSGPIDRHTVDQLVVEHLPAALRLATRLAGDVHVADDVVQEALCRVLSGWRGFRGEATFRTWMLQIVVNVDRDRRRRLRESVDLQMVDVVSPNAEPNEHASVAELSANIRAAIENLPDRQREVAVLLLGQGLAVAEVAQILEVSPANVHTCLHLARKRIAKAIGVDYARET